MGVGEGQDDRCWERRLCSPLLVQNGVIQGVLWFTQNHTARYSWNSSLLIYSSFPFPTLHTTLNCGESSFSGACETGWSFSLKESTPGSPSSAVHCWAVCAPPLMSVAPWVLPWSFPSSCRETGNNGEATRRLP